jgi:AI-2 transport protein TqsA
MSANTQLSPLTRLLIIGACFVIVIGGIHSVAYLVNPILLGMIISLLCAPFLHWLTRRGVPAGLALLIVLLIVIATGAVLIGFAGLSLSQLNQKLPAYQARIAEMEAAARSWLDARGIDPAALASVDALDPTRIVQFATSVLSELGKLLSNGLLALSIVGFMMFEVVTFPAKVRKALGPGQKLADRFAVHGEGIRQYVYSRALTGLAVAGGDMILLLILGVDFPLLWGLWSLFSRVIPNVGWILALIPPFLLALLQFGVGRALIVFFGYWLINSLANSVIEPRYMKHRFRLSPLVAFLSLLFWGWVLGAVGLLLAVPLTYLLVFVLESEDDTRPLAIMLSAVDADEASGDADAAEGLST